MHIHIIYTQHTHVIRFEKTELPYTIITIPILVFKVLFLGKRDATNIQFAWILVKILVFGWQKSLFSIHVTCVLYSVQLEQPCLPVVIADLSYNV